MALGDNPFQARCRRVFDAVHPFDDVSDAVLHRSVMGFGREAAQGIYDRVSGAGSADDRGVLGSRPCLVLSVLRGGFDPDVPDYRDLGRQAPYLCQLQIFPLHAPWVASHARCHYGDVLDGWYNGYSEPSGVQIPFRDADMAVARLLRLLCGEDADVACAHMAAGCACGGANCRVGDFGGDFVENGRVWFHPVLDPDVPRGVALFCAVCVRIVGCRDCLYVPRGPHAGRYQKTDRLFVSRPYGLCDDGAVYADVSGYSGRDVPDGEPRDCLRRIVPCGGCRLRPDAYARNFGLWRACSSNAALCDCVHGVHDGECRTAGNVRVCR